MSFGVLHNMTNLLHIDLSRNDLGYAFSIDTLGSIFREQYNLKYLDLSDNKIQTIPEKFFKGLKNISTLKLHNNLLTSANFDLHYKNKLRWLDLRNNLLETVSESMRTQLNTLSLIEPVYIDISNNTFASRAMKLISLNG